MSGDPTADPNFTGVQQPTFDRLVSSHTRAADQLDRLARDLWTQLTRLGVDASPALRIRGLAGEVRRDAGELQQRQRRVHTMEQNGGTGFCTPSGTYWAISESAMAAPLEDSPSEILGLLMTDPGIHPVNLPPDLVAYAKEMARRNGISERLMLAILWQEQQWYQGVDPGLDGAVAVVGHVWDWALQQSLKPDKSLGIAHMKLATVRQLLAHGPVPGVDTALLAGLDDAQLAKFLEENPKADIALSAAYLRQLSENPYGAQTDKQVFLLYAADTPQVRAMNARHGDDTASRGFAIRSRAENWDRLVPRLDAAARWEALTPAQRRAAIDKLAAQVPAGQPVEVYYPFYYPPPDVDLPYTGTGPVPPGIPTPTPGPSPTPP